ncbi:copper resistance protein B [Hydrocarboniclastica marina]|uniref:Copper resistance protein B n=1 Tax=Hydrocarboniclastica marina TaxID=2259620 RepID=A0A4P7XHS8_9ALTE|nr:copper resistance protein B [Hydrocarboniclastica marina]QCF26024.1 copper resistance protein B [Hydrocarboniclastica marina]
MNRHTFTERTLIFILATLILTTPALAEEISGKETQTARTFWGLAAEKLEYRYSDTDEELAYIEGDAFYGTDELKLRWLLEAEWDKAHSAWETLENQFVIQTPVSEFWDAKAGLRVDTPKGQNRRYGVLGLTGLAPQWLEVDTSLFVSDKGDASMDFEVEYELLVTNYWIASASFETRIAFHEDRETGVGEGLNHTETGIRLSYDLAYRSFSPYVGVVHERQYGAAADMTEAEGGDTENWFAVIGARMMF